MYLHQILQLVASGISLSEIEALTPEIRKEIFNSECSLHTLVKYISIAELAALPRDVRNDFYAAQYYNIEKLIRGRVISSTQLASLDRDLRISVLTYPDPVIRMMQEKNISIELLSNIRSEKLNVILKNAQLSVDQQAAAIQEFQPAVILEHIIKSDQNGSLKIAIRDLWKETRSDNVKLFSKTEAEITYRAIQKLFVGQPASRERAISALSLMLEFAMRDNNKGQPFASALKNKFNLDAIPLDYVASLRSHSQDSLSASSAPSSSS